VKFSERIGIVPPLKELSLESMPPELRAGLWDVTRMTFFEEISGEYDYLSQKGEMLAEWIWFYHFREPADEIPEKGRILLAEIRSRFFHWDWHEVYDFVEYLCGLEVSEHPLNISEGSHSYASLCNEVLAREMAILRFVDLKLVKISDEIEISEIASSTSSSYLSISEHFKKALAFLSDRKSPDYRNSIKESISGVEAAARIVTGNQTATLGNALIQLQKTDSLHPALAKGFSNLYGWTSDKSGIRHALIDGDLEIQQNEAHYMLVSCSAFANYLVASRAD